MKQIFEWVRKQPLKAFKVYDGSIGVEPSEVNRLINEAEAKWESECCEYKPRKAYKVGLCYTTGCGKERTRTLHYDSKYCEYCGKPIKVLEVE